jgi:hypothetical protein
MDGRGERSIDQRAAIQETDAAVEWNAAVEGHLPIVQQNEYVIEGGTNHD